MIGADIGAAGRKLSRHLGGSIDALLPPDFASTSQILVDALPNQVGDRSASRRRGVPKSFDLVFRQLYLCPDHANMLA